MTTLLLENEFGSCLVGLSSIVGLLGALVSLAIVPALVCVLSPSLATAFWASFVSVILFLVIVLVAACQLRLSLAVNPIDDPPKTLWCMNGRNRHRVATKTCYYGKECHNSQCPYVHPKDAN